MRKLYALLVILFLFASCKKSNSGCSLSSASILGTWKVTAEKSAITGTSIFVDTYSQWPDCEKDNTFTFASDGTLTVSEGAFICSPSAASTVNWSLKGNTLVTSTGDDYVTVTGFSCSQMELTVTNLLNGYTDIQTYTKQ